MKAHAPATWIKQPCAVFTANDLDAAGGIVVRGNRIVELVGTDKEPLTPVDDVFDASGLVLLPGLINGHHHFYQTLTRAYPPALNKPLFDWLKTLYPVWANLTEEAIAVSTRLALAELMLSGCTTASDHHYLFSAALTRAIDVQAEAARELGMRGGADPRLDEPLGRRRRSAAPVRHGAGIDDCGRIRTPDRALPRRGAARHVPDRARALLAVLGDPGADARDRATGARTWGQAPYAPGRNPGRKRLLRGEVRDAPPRLPRGGGLAGRRCLARPRHPLHAVGDRTPGSGRHRCLPLPVVQHGAGVGNLPGQRPALGGGARGAWASTAPRPTTAPT